MTDVPKPPTRAAFTFIFITVCLDMLALGIIVPVLPRLITAFEGGNYANAARMVGLFGFGWAAMQFIFSPVMGALSDRFGRRPVVIMSNIGLGLDYFVMAVAPSVNWLFLGRLISGVTAATISTASAYIADVTPPEKRAGKFGLLGAAFGLGFVIGPALGGFLGEISLRLPFYVAGGFGVLNGLYGFFVLPESLSKERRAPFRWRNANPLGALKLLRSHPMLISLAAASFVQRIAHDGLPSLFVLYTDYRYGWKPAEVGMTMAAVGISTMVVSAGLTGPLVKRIGERAVLMIALVCGAIGFATYGLAPTGAIFLIGLPLLALWGMGNPTMQAFMTARVDSTEQGQLQGALASLSGVAGMIGPILMTQTFAIGVKETMNLPGLPYLVASSMVIIALILCARATARRPVTAPVESVL